MNHVNEDVTGRQPPHQEQKRQPHDATDCRQPSVIPDLTSDSQHDAIRDTSIRRMPSDSKCPKSTLGDMCDPPGVTPDATKLDTNVTRDTIHPVTPDCDQVKSKHCPPNDTAVMLRNEEQIECKEEKKSPTGINNGETNEKSKEELQITQDDTVNEDDEKTDGAKVVGAKEKSKQGKKSKSKQRSDDESSSDSDSDSDDSSSDSDSSSSSNSTSSKSGTTSSTTDSSDSSSSSSSSDSESESPAESAKKKKKKKKH